MPARHKFPPRAAARNISATFFQHHDAVIQRRDGFDWSPAREVRLTSKSLGDIIAVEPANKLKGWLPDFLY